MEMTSLTNVELFVCFFKIRFQIDGFKILLKKSVSQRRKQFAWCTNPYLQERNVLYLL